MAIKEAIQAQADIITAFLNVDKKTGILSETESAFEKTLPEGLTAEVVAQVDQARTTFVAASTVAAGKLAVDAMASNKELTEVNGSLALGGTSSLDLSFKRSQEVTKVGTDDKITKYGTSAVGYNFEGGRGSVGQLKAARAAVADYGLEKLASKK